uniref:Small ribosomal subunit protein uS14c n=1 Tax=Hypertelis spergulacea TaxID=764270 RepID=A0A411L8T0_9CARY|nr:ribosomal protein S14 [Hypertelis spergulacea]
MARKSWIQRDRKRYKLVQKFQLIRRALRKELKQKERSKSKVEEKWEIRRKFESLPRDSSPTRLRKRCFLTGRPRAIFRDFGLSGHVLREMFHECLLPGATRSSW